MGRKCYHGTVVILFLMNLLAGCSDSDSGVEVGPCDWSQTIEASVPYPSSDRAVAYDENRGVLVVFGGTGLADTWEYDGKSWRRISTEHAPPQTYGGSACYYPGEKAIFFFGGYGTIWQEHRSTWLYDGRDWRKLAPECIPPARKYSRLCYDEHRQCIVMYGGMSDENLRDTWEWKEGNWNEVQTTVQPGLRWGYGLAYCPSIRRVIFFGGERYGVSYNDTWSYDGVEWNLLNTGESPTRRSFTAMTTDVVKNGVVLFGGRRDGNSLSDFWFFDGSRWERIVDFSLDEKLFNPIIARRPSGHEYWVFCCSDEYLEEDSRVYQLSSDSFSEGPNTPGPMPYCSSLVYHPDKGTFLLMSHQDFLNGDSLWQYQNSSWQQSDLAAPQGISCLSLLYDTHRHILLAIDETQGTYSQSKPFIIKELMGDTWQKREFYERPRAYTGFAIAYDEHIGAVVIFGGNYYYPDHQNTNETWLYDGNTLRRVFPKRSPSARADAVMTYDALRKKIILFGGHEGYYSAYRRDTWEFDSNTWKRVNTAHAPPLTGTMVYHHGLQKTLMYTGTDEYSHNSAEFWTYDGVDWTLIDFKCSPGDRFKVTMASDPDENRVILFGGRVDYFYDDVHMADTWELSL